ncbi:hypothetical protein EKO27_g8663 [Xylaria grammica]|uniref:Uncharacterized protein n=1 Tax=Xylaria grammica TaxID=363999 RepID=A0A439CWQ5_9PEZI|nr:hypothetical protein EKO27_g8663 [Xylaria grammica]
MRRTIQRLARPSPPYPRVQPRSPPVHVNKPAWEDPTVDVEPSQNVTSMYRQHGIIFPYQLRPLKGIFSGNNPYHLGVSYSQEHCVLHQSMKFFDRIEHPFMRPLLDIYVEKNKEPLWFSGFAHGEGAFPNKTASKKITHALREALAEAGYDRFGRKVLVDGESSAVADLYGTLRVTTNKPLVVCNANFTELLECAKAIVARAEKELQRDKNGRHIEGPQWQHYPPRHSAQRGPKRQHNGQQHNNQRVRRSY